jgi:hypothetical protein
MIIRGSIHRGSIHRWVDSLQGRFIVGSIHRKVNSSQCYENLIDRSYWKGSFTEIYLIENVVFIQVYFEDLVRGQFAYYSVKLAFQWRLVETKKVFTTKRTQFCMSRRKIIALRWIDPVTNWSCDESTMRWIDPWWIDPAMNRLCDESTLRWIDPQWIRRWIDAAIDRPYDESTLWWIHPAMNWPCD